MPLKMLSSELQNEIKDSLITKKKKTRRSMPSNFITCTRINVKHNISLTLFYLKISVNPNL